MTSRSLQARDRALTHGARWSVYLALVATLFSALCVPEVRCQPRETSAVETADEFAAALARGDNHITIKQHMDLAPLTNGTSFGRVFTTTRSIRGDCDAVPAVPGLLPGMQQPRLRPRQCFLFVAGRFLTWQGGVPAAWVDNVYIQLAPRTAPSEVVLIDWVPADSGARLWVTGSTLHGDALPPVPGSSSCIGIQTKNAPAYLNECTFRKTSLSAVAAKHATSLQRCAFIDNVSMDPASASPAGVVHAIGFVADLFKKLGVKMSGCSWTNSTHADLGVDNAAVAYSDIRPPAISLNPRGGGRVQPLEQASGFLTGDDDGLVAIKQQLGLAQAAPAAAKKSAPTAAIAGGVIAAVACVAIALVLFLWRRRRQRRRLRGGDDGAHARQAEKLEAHGSGMLAQGVHSAPSSKGAPSSLQRGSESSLVRATLGGQTGSSGGQGTTVSSGADHSRSTLSPLGAHGPYGSPHQALAVQSADGEEPPGAPWPSVGTAKNSARYTGIVESTVNTMSTIGGSRRGAITVAQRTRHGQLVTALDNMLYTQPPVLFAGKYLLVNERVSGGQAAVQFARGRDGGFMQYAIKFCHHREDFAMEVDLYRDPLIRETLPMLVDACDNADGALVSHSGWAFPPHLVLERGASLSDWRRSRRGFHMVLHMMHDLAQCLEIVHRAGRVHRDIKPGNSLLMLHSQCWRLIDFGIAAEIGESVAPRCTLAYAAPEVLAAYAAKQRVPADPAHDIWALGVMSYECLTHTTAFPLYLPPSTVFQVAAGDTEYPWEGSAKDHTFQKSKARPVIEACLSRDARKRPTAQQLLKMIDALGNNATIDVAP